MRSSTCVEVAMTLTLWLIVVLSTNVSECHSSGLGFLGPIFGPWPEPPSSSLPTTPSSPPRPSNLKIGFYKGLCPNKSVDIEAILSNKVKEQFLKKASILPALLRMQFHDCFVHGCDASILIDGPSSERKAGGNLSVREYELIEALKDIAEADCPGVVSCADIIAIATTKVIELGGGPVYSVQTGRLDGLVSSDEDVDLPSPFDSVDIVISSFAAKGFTPEEMVVLLGCHTVGISHCQFFQDRLYENTSQFDKDMDQSLRKQLIPVCPQGAQSNNFTDLDQNPPSSNIVDNSFFNQILKKRGILPIDQELTRSTKTEGFVLQLAQNSSLFISKLESAMLKLQALEDPLTQGEIRRTCSQFN